MEKANKNKQLKVLLVNGSPHHCGNTFTALSEVAKTLEEKDIKTEIVHIGNRPVQCIACYKCREKSFCVFQDEIYLTLREKLAKANASSSVRQSISVGHREVSVPCSTACSIPVASWHSTSRLHL